MLRIVYRTSTVRGRGRHNVESALRAGRIVYTRGGQPRAGLGYFMARMIHRTFKKYDYFVQTFLLNQQRPRIVIFKNEIHQKQITVELDRRKCLTPIIEMHTRIEVDLQKLRDLVEKQVFNKLNTYNIIELFHNYH